MGTGTWVVFVYAQMPVPTANFGNVCWLHFAVRPKDNRRRIALIKA